jgi:hypothetical protein
MSVVPGDEGRVQRVENGWEEEVRVVLHPLIDVGESHVA